MSDSKLFEKQLESNIFQVDKGKKKGFKAFLNINSLPQLFQCLKAELSPLENSCLNEYELQNHLIELCFMPNKFNKFRTMKELILLEIRNNSKFWILNSDVYTQILARSNVSTTTQSLSEENLEKPEKTEKIIKTDTNFEGMETYIKYLSQITSLKRKYSYIREYETTEELEYREFNITQPDVTHPPLDEKSLNTEDNQELFEKFLQFNDTQRLTRHQKKRLYDDSNLNYSQDFNKYINQKSVTMRKKREEEFLNSIFVPNRFMKYPKIEFQAFPYIFKFLCKMNDKTLDKKSQFRLQNLLFYLLLQEKQARKKFRMNQNLYSENHENHENGGEKEQKTEEVSKKCEDLISDEVGLLSDFIKYCHNEGFLVENVFFNDQRFRSKQKVLLTNVFNLCSLYLKKREVEYHRAECDRPTNSESDHLLYESILEELEQYENLEESIAVKLVEFYIWEVEVKKSQFEANEETFHEYNYLNEAFQKDPTRNVMGSFSSIEKIDEALQNFDQMINSPTMKKKRAYKFHSEERGEWNEGIYKKFLEGLLKFYDNSINNKKISKFIGSGISANHVKFVKGKYLRRLKKRSKDLKISAKELLAEDIANFDIKTFDFIINGNKKI